MGVACGFLAWSCVSYIVHTQPLPYAWCYIFLPVVVLSYILYICNLEQPLVASGCSYVVTYKSQCTDEKNRKSLHAPNLAVAANWRYLKFACAYVCWFVLNIIVYLVHSLNFLINFTSHWIVARFPPCRTWYTCLFKTQHVYIELRWSVEFSGTSPL